jgi:thiamine pyrophosphate-dependent acetolactate synthase large subunit-like protein
MSGNHPRLDRRAAMRALLEDRGDLVLVTGLGSTTWDAASVGDDDRNFYLWGAMGSATMVGLGLAIAQSDRRVLVVTGDGEMLMGLGALATIGMQRPPNLAVVVFDGETGMQPSHTESAVELTGVARSCGIKDLRHRRRGGTARVCRAGQQRGHNLVRAHSDLRQRAAARSTAARRRFAEDALRRAFGVEH